MGKKGTSSLIRYSKVNEASNKNYCVLQGVNGYIKTTTWLHQWYVRIVYKNPSELMFS